MSATLSEVREEEGGRGEWGEVRDENVGKGGGKGRREGEERSWRRRGKEGRGEEEKEEKEKGRKRRRGKEGRKEEERERREDVT